MARSCFSSQYDIPPANLVELGTVHKVSLAFYKTPDDFYLHLDSSKESLDSLTTSLTKYCRSTRPHDGFEAREGVYCAARFATNNMWYRARILKRLPDGVQLQYIDYGNHDLVKLDHLRPLHKSHASVPALALHCSIPSVRLAMKFDKKYSGNASGEG
ncbi:tudor domain-containing protein 1-like [Haemaphysalis longicornis]